MCFILTGIKLKDDESSKNAILGVLKSEQRDNPHGTGSLCYSLDKKPEIWRGEFKDWNLMKADLDNFDIFNFHFRLATIGKKTKENVHFWQIGNWAFCHNGIIGGIGDDNESDSLVFFKQLIKSKFLTKDNQLKGKKIKDYVNILNFGGRFLIINLKTKNIYFFGDFNLYVLNKSYLVFTSSSASYENTFSIMGLNFPDESQTVESIDSTIDGVWMLNFATQTFSQIFETFIEQKEYAGYYMGSRPRENNTTLTLNAEEKEALNNKDVLLSKVRKKEKKNKIRQYSSYEKEFQNRMKNYIRKYPEIALDIEAEREYNQVNEFGRTNTEEEFWELWIAPKMEADYLANVKVGE